MRAALEPLGWTVNKVEHDYGVDFDAQIFRDHQATGEWFKIQLKSSASPRYKKDGSSLSLSLNRKHAEHFARDMRDPMFIIHADVKTGAIRWYAPQLDRELREWIKRRPARPTATLHIPADNNFGDGLVRFLSTLESVQIYLGAKSVLSASASDFACVIADQGEQERCIRSFQNKIDALKIDKVQHLFGSSHLDEARKITAEIVSNTWSSVESKFTAILARERIDIREFNGSNLPQSELHQIFLKTSRDLRALTRKGPPALKFFSIIATKAAELGVLAFKDVGLFMNWKLHVERNDPVMAVGAYIESVQSAKRVTKKYNQCLRLANYASKSRHLWALPIALARIVEALALFFIHLENEPNPEVQRAYLESAVKLCRLAARAAEWNSDQRSLGSVAACALFLWKADPEGAAALEEDILAKIRDPEVKRNAEELLSRRQRRARGEHLPGDIKTTLGQGVENMASALGINMTDPSDPMATLVRLGIKDANPERALTHCKETFVSLGPPPNPAAAALSRALKLSSIMSKVLHCDRHGYWVEGPTLDEILADFKLRYCDRCPDRDARPVNWKYTDEWQAHENVRHQEFMLRYYRARANRPARPSLSAAKEVQNDR